MFRNLLSDSSFFLKGRIQRVRLRSSNTFSDWIEVTAGMHQGTWLGPLTFVMYTRLYAALPRHDAALLRGPRQAAGLGSQGGRRVARSKPRVLARKAASPRAALPLHMDAGTYVP